MVVALDEERKAEVEETNPEESVVTLTIIGYAAHNNISGFLSMLKNIFHFILINSLI